MLLFTSLAPFTGLAPFTELAPTPHPLRRWSCHLALAAGLILGAFAPPAGAATPLRVVFIAYENPDQLMEDVRPVVAYLEERLDRPVKAFAATDYAGVVEALRNETADIGFMGSLQYVMAREHAGAYPLLGELYGGSSTYRARLFVRKDSGITKPEQLRGRTVAFTDPMSSSGFLYPLDIFRQAGLITGREDADRFFQRTYFAGGDEQALRAVLNRFVDAAGIGQFAFSLLRPEERDEVTWIAESRPIPSHCVVARKNLPPREAEAFKKALLELAGGPRRSLLRYLYNVDGYVEVGPETFTDVEGLARDFGFLGTPGR